MLFSTRPDKCMLEDRLEPVKKIAVEQWSDTCSSNTSFFPQANSIHVMHELNSHSTMPI